MNKKKRIVESFKGYVLKEQNKTMEFTFPKEDGSDLRYEYNRHHGDINGDYTIEFNVKNPKIDDSIFDEEDYNFELETGSFTFKYLNACKAELETIYDSIEDCGLLGRSGGWFAIGLYSNNVESDNYDYQEDELDGFRKDKLLVENIWESEDYPYDEDGQLKDNSEVFDKMHEIVKKYYHNYGHNLAKFYGWK